MLGAVEYDMNEVHGTIRLTLSREPAEEKIGTKDSL